MIKHHVNKITDRNKKCFAHLLIDAYATTGKGMYRLALHCLLAGKTVTGYIHLSRFMGLIECLIDAGNSLLATIKGLFHAKASYKAA